MAALLALQAATALEDGLGSPAHLVVDTLPSAQGSPRVHEAATLYKAPKQSSRASRPSPPRAPPRAPSCRRKRSHSSRTWRRCGAASAASVGGWARCW
jgi:hypothetical protein